MKRHFLAAFAAFLCLFIFFSFTVSASTSVALGDRSMSSGSLFSWSSGSSPSGQQVEWASQLVAFASESGFDIAGWERWTLNGRIAPSVATYTWVSDDQYILTFQYQVYNGLSLVASYGHSPSMPEGDVLGAYDYTGDFGTYRVTLKVTARLLTTESKTTALYAYSDNIFSGDAVIIGLPVFSPVSASTEQDILNSLNRVSKQLDELMDYLSDPPSDFSDYYESMQGVIDSQASMEGAINSVADSLISDALGDFNIDASSLGGQLDDALGGDPGGSSFIRFFQWVWTINPMLVIEVSLVVTFFIIFLIVRTYP